MTSKGKYFPCSRSLNLEKAEIRTKGGSIMNSPYRESGGGVGWIILLVLLYIIFNPIPGPIDDAAAVALGGYQALKRL
jgi:hypothetical protein